MSHVFSTIVVFFFALCCITSQCSKAIAKENAVIFNGKDLSGWVVEMKGKGKEDGKQDKPVWSVEDGAIHSTGKVFGFLRYQKKVCDFVFEVEYKIAAKTNSGLGIRTVPYKGSAKTRPSFACYEIQILDDKNGSPTKKSSSSLYRYLAPRLNATQPAGEWNQMKIECRGPHIKITLNGKLVQDVDQRTVKKMRSKPLCGYVCLQSHNGKAWFRNIKLVELKKKMPITNNQNREPKVP